MLKKLLAVTIICLFIGLNIASSTGNIVDEVDSYDYKPREINSSKAITESVTIWYIIRYYEGGIGLFGGNVLLCNLTGFIDFPEGITYRNDTIIAVDSIGDIYEINPNTCNVSFLGSTEIDEFVDIEYDVQEDMLWGISNDNFYGINTTNFEATLIGPMGNQNNMISLVGDTNGNIWALDLSFSGSLFYKINKSTGEANIIGNTGVVTNFDQDMSYDCYEDIIYWCAFNYMSFSPELWTINVTNANSNFVGTLVHHIRLLAISNTWLNYPPITSISLDPFYPDGDNGWYVNNVTAILKSWDDSEVCNIYYRVAGGEWINHSGDEVSFVLDYDCLENGLIEFYAVDNEGLEEEIKSKNIDMDQLPPDIGEAKWEVFQDPPVYGLWYVTFTVNATDTCSGIERVEMFINDGFHAVAIGPGPTYEFTIEWSAVFKSATFGFYCCDEAGNVASVLVNGSDIESYSYSQSYSMLFLQWLGKFPLLQRLLDILGGYQC